MCLSAGMLVFWCTMWKKALANEPGACFNLVKSSFNNMKSNPKAIHYRPVERVGYRVLATLDPATFGGPRHQPEITKVRQNVPFWNKKFKNFLPRGAPWKCLGPHKNVSPGPNAALDGPHTLTLTLRLLSHKYEYKSGTIWVPVYEFQQTWVCAYFNGGRSHTYEYGLPVNFTRTSSFCAGCVFIQPVLSKLRVNSINRSYKSCGTHLTSELTSL